MRIGVPRGLALIVLAMIAAPARPGAEVLDGRLYTIDITAADANGNTAACTTTVTVPHDKGKS